MKQCRSGSNATNTAVPSYEEMTDPSLQRKVDDGRPRIPSTPSTCWLTESRGLRGAKPPQTLGQVPPQSGQLDGAARIEEVGCARQQLTKYSCLHCEL